MAAQTPRLQARLGDAIAAARKQRKWTQAELAEAASVSTKSVTTVEAGRKVSLRTLRAIETALDWAPETAERMLAGHGQAPKPVAAIPGGRPDVDALAVMLLVTYRQDGRQAFAEEYAELAERFDDEVMIAIRRAYAEVSVEDEAHDAR